MKLKIKEIGFSTYLKYGIGLGLAVFPIAYYPMPVVGRLIFLIFSLYFIFSTEFGKWDWGSRWVYIPLLVILGVSVIRLFIYHNADEAYSVSFLSIMVVLYLASRKLGAGIFKVLIPFVIVEIASVILIGITGNATGGIIAPPGNDQLVGMGRWSNYNLAVGYIGYGAVLLRGKWQWVLVAIALIALFFTGAMEAVFIVGIIGVIVLLRRDWGKRLWLPIGAIAGCVLLWVLLSGGFDGLYRTWTYYKGTAQNLDANVLSIATQSRVSVYIQAIKNLSIFGHGYTNSFFNVFTVHNVPLIVFDQLGILAGAAWIVATVYCLIKTKWKYAWAFVLIAGVFDHWIWTQYAPFWFCLLGVSTSSNIKNDLIFRVENGQSQS